MHEYGEFPIGDHPDITEIDSLIGKLELVPESRLLIECLQSACSYRRDGKLPEYSQSLVHALAAAQSLPEKTARANVSGTLGRLLQKISAVEPRPGPELVDASPEVVKLAEFFSNAEVSFGIFYPKKHVVAVFSSPAQAQKGLGYLRTAGLSSPCLKSKNVWT